MSLTKRLVFEDVASMKSRNVPVGAILVALHIFACIASAEDKNGIRLEVTKKTLDRADGQPTYYSYQAIDRTMAIKATVRNVAMGKDLPEGKITCVVLLRSWISSETGSLLRYAKEVKLEPLKTSKSAELNVGEYHIGGHMHGTSDQHVDHVAAWKISIDHGGKVTEFLSSPSFEALNKRATDARTR